MDRNDLFNNIRNIKVHNEVLNSIDEWGVKLNNELLSILHVNVFSLDKHWNWLMIKLANILPNLDVLVFTEINLKEEQAMCYQLRHFNQISSCRKGRGGGVMVFTLVNS